MKDADSAEDREQLQQCLPLAVLKHYCYCHYDYCELLLQQCLPLAVLKLATRALVFIMLTPSCNSAYRLRYWNLSVPFSISNSMQGCNSAYRLRYWNASNLSARASASALLQQCLPLAVLKPTLQSFSVTPILIVATVLTACGIETRTNPQNPPAPTMRCNSTYRLRYATKGARQQRSKATMRPAHL